MNTTTVPWRTTLSAKPGFSGCRKHPKPSHHVAVVRAFRRSDFDGFASKMTSGETWRDAWRKANDGFEEFMFEVKKTAERLDRRYSVSRHLSSAAKSAVVRAKEIDREFKIEIRWRTFSMDFSRNWPRYREQINYFFDSQVGKSFATIFFLWFALSGWLFRVLIFGTWVLPIAGPLLIGTLANKLVIKGACPACKKQFVGYKNQMIRCAGCRNIVWQPQGDSFSRGTRNRSTSKSDPQIIDVEFEER